MFSYWQDHLNCNSFSFKCDILEFLSHFYCILTIPKLKGIDYVITRWIDEVKWLLSN